MRKLFVVTLAILALMLTGCGTDPRTAPKVTTGDVEDSQATIGKLDEADTIHLHKAFISFGDQWTVEVNGEEIATIKGQPIYLIGDTYSMFTNNGNLMGSEGEQFRVVNHRAKLYNYDSKEIGFIDEEILSWLYKANIYQNDRRVGVLNQKFSLGLQGSIKTPGGKNAWSFQRKIMSVGADITIKREGKSDVRAMNAIWATVILNEVIEAQSSKNNNNKK